MIVRFLLNDLCEVPPPRVGLFDVLGVFGDVDPEIVARILYLRPTSAELELAAAALAAGPDAAIPLAGAAAAIYQLVAVADVATP